MKKYKHKITGKIASIGVLYYAIEGEPSQLPLWLLENSNDWEEIIEVLEYVRCIKGDNGIEINKIYKVIKRVLWDRIDDEFVYYLDEKLSSPYYTTYFIPSTKEEYDAQFKDYEILSFKLEMARLTSGIRYKNKYGYFHVGEKDDFENRDNEFSEKVLLEEKSGYVIHSIKRLSDNEVFTIGDKVDFKGCNIKSDTLTKITIRPYSPFDLRLWASYTEDYPEAYSIDRLTHHKEPLFITEDGVGMFSGNTVYYVETEEEPELCFKINEYVLLEHSGRFTSDGSLHSFSTKEKAQEYIDNNKPVFTKQQIRDALNNMWLLKNTVTKDRLFKEFEL